MLFNSDPSGLNCTLDPIPPSYIQNNQNRLRQDPYSIWKKSSKKQQVTSVSVPKRKSLPLIPEPGVPVDVVPSFLREEVGVLYDRVDFSSNSLSFPSLSVGKQFRILTSALPNDSPKCNHADRSVDW